MSHPINPYELLRLHLFKAGWGSSKALAEELGVVPSVITGIKNGKHPSPDVALKLSNGITATVGVMLTACRVLSSHW